MIGFPHNQQLLIVITFLASGIQNTTFAENFSFIHRPKHQAGKQHKNTLPASCISNNQAYSWVTGSRFLSFNDGFRAFSSCIKISVKTANGWSS
jgi:hypothetical protein